MIHDQKGGQIMRKLASIEKVRKVEPIDGADRIPCSMINCFCMFSDYKPLTLSEWIDVDRKRRAEQPDRRIDNGTSRADNE